MTQTQSPVSERISVDVALGSLDDVSFHSAPDSVDAAARVTRFEGAAESRRARADEDVTGGSSAADPLIGLVVAGRYRIVEPIARGGMGIVYKVEHVELGKLLAMKLLTGELARNPDVVRRFKREALAVSRLESPNTVQVFDFGQASGVTYLVMELVRGQTLGQLIRGKQAIDSARLGKIVVQICSSLAEAHRKGITHRDVKPDNVMLVVAADGTEVAKVLDFGLAKLLESEPASDVTGPGTIMGTPHYMAPEQVVDGPVDARTDVYGVGALMYRALTGAFPFTGRPMEVLAKRLTQTPVPPNERAPGLGIPDGMSRIVMKAMEISADDRYASIEALQGALVEEIETEGSSSVERLLDSGWVRRIARTRVHIVRREPEEDAAYATRDEVDAYEQKLRRRRWGATALIAAGLALAIGAVTSAWLGRDRPFAGVELEPNDTAAEATPLPLGHTVVAKLGKRIDATHGDRDFFVVDVPASDGERTNVRLRLGSLPNIPLCALLYKASVPDPLGQYCAGKPNVDLTVPSITLDPGRTFVVVVQDLDPHGGPDTHIEEDVSDTYTLAVEPADG